MWGYAVFMVSKLNNVGNPHPIDLSIQHNNNQNPRIFILVEINKWIPKSTWQ